MDEDMIECFALIVWYNDYVEIVEEWRHNIHVCASENRPFYFIDSYQMDGSFEYGQIEVLRMWLVILYGWYGTSPRSGWINKPNDCAHFLDEVMYRIHVGG